VLPGVAKSPFGCITDHAEQSAGNMLLPDPIRPAAAVERRTALRATHGPATEKGRISAGDDPSSRSLARRDGCGAAPA
jgi:hypothetical protein